MRGGRRISLKYPARCAECGAALEVGTLARYYGPRKVYGTECHEQRPQARASYQDSGAGAIRQAAVDARRGYGRGEGKQVWFGGERIPASRAPGGVCEDAPCCGCCGPGSDDPAYHESDPYDAYDEGGRY